MSATRAPAARPGAAARTAALRAGLASFGAVELSLAAFMAFAPHAFFRAVGPFSVFNAHYVRDVASFEGALGIALLIALARPAWRVPVLAVTAIQFALHAVNHLVDIAGARPAWVGYSDFASLAGATFVLVLLLGVALADNPEGGPP